MRQVDCHDGLVTRARTFGVEDTLLCGMSPKTHEGKIFVRASRGRRVRDIQSRNTEVWSDDIWRVDNQTGPHARASSGSHTVNVRRHVMGEQSPIRVEALVHLMDGLWDFWPYRNEDAAGWPSVDQAQPQSDCHCFGPIADIQFFVERAQIGLYCGLGDLQLSGDLLVFITQGE